MLKQNTFWTLTFIQSVFFYQHRPWVLLSSCVFPWLYVWMVTVWVHLNRLPPSGSTLQTSCSCLQLPWRLSRIVAPLMWAFYRHSSGWTNSELISSTLSTLSNHSVEPTYKAHKPGIGTNTFIGASLIWQMAAENCLSLFQWKKEHSWGLFPFTCCVTGSWWGVGGTGSIVVQLLWASSSRRCGEQLRQDQYSPADLHQPWRGGQLLPHLRPVVRGSGEEDSAFKTQSSTSRSWTNGHFLSCWDSKALHIHSEE